MSLLYCRPSHLENMNWAVTFLLLIMSAVATSMETNSGANDLCECGLINNDQNKIVGGNPANRNEYPWMVSLHRTAMFLFMGHSASQFCGGTLISENWVLTAAHCTIQYRLLAPLITVNLGDYDLSTDMETSTVQRLASHVEIHPDFSPMTLNNDISLVRMITPVQFNNAIRPACLPPPDFSLDGKSVTIIGWGATKEGGAGSTTLLEANVPVVPNDECQLRYNSTGVTVTPHMLCAGQAGRDSCQGDSGGPVVMNCNDNYSVVGVVSFGIGCARPQYPGVYARTSAFLTWIQRKTVGEVCGRSSCGQIDQLVTTSSRYKYDFDYYNDIV